MSLLAKMKGLGPKTASDASLHSKDSSNRSSLERPGSTVLSPNNINAGGSRIMGSRGWSKLSRGKSTKEQPPMQAIWNNQQLVMSTHYVVMDGTFYFPKDELHDEFFKPGDYFKDDPKKGKAMYLDITVDGKVHTNAAYYFPEPKPVAAPIKNMVAFWKGVPVTPYDEDEEEAEGSGTGTSDVPTPIATHTPTAVAQNAS
eukprot:CAMPEP_0184693370 /NCGR_PEP_ID=MMETSP0313-20130426/1610_1 /TAXON_ID=2792 /ORGANISM="Porphyridium aerugineum, Strain SAG 1380-2" /LENGTH=199 /DNA_ID=CAMNT_0027151435 /DNA_START=196 /DNA_END=795 /DNA_ORIENTATION=-